MRKFISSKHLEGVSDLTLSAPVKQGFIDAFESATYETRLRLLMKALFKIRSTAREHSEIKPFVDTAERIQSLLDFRLAILDTEPRRLLLSATFDKPFEPYMRLIWDPLGPLLDLIFCNCEGYVTATEHSFDDYLAWVRKSQIDTNFFYAATGQSVTDIQYVTQLERLAREANNPISPTAVVAANLEDGADEVRCREKKRSDRMGMEALVALYKLADFYPARPIDGDGKYLRWATQQLLKGWDPKALGPLALAVSEQLGWLGTSPLEPREPSLETRLQFDESAVQGGFLSNYGQKEEEQEARPVQHGALLLMRIIDPAKARTFIGGLEIQREGGSAPADGIYLNLAFTRQGLENIGVAADEIGRFPQEFREGMEERAGLLGDLRGNHPRNWHLPERNWPPAASRHQTVLPPVDMSEVDIVLQVRTTTPYAAEYKVDDDEAEKHPLHGTIAMLGADPGASGVRLLAVEAMHPARSDGSGRDHFGFVDGLSQPKPVDGPARRLEDEVPRGDILWGYANSRMDRPQSASRILDNGTFLVIRKLSQEVGRFRAFLDREAGKAGFPLTADELAGKMMGRSLDGRPLAVPDAEPGYNRFGYGEDSKGEGCPFQAHVRRTNPRTERDETHGRPTPRILRRGMSYGPLCPEEGDDGAKRGVFFMAYNASIAEQFEVIQRWVSGGNSTGVASWHSDPLMGVAQDGDPRTFRFQHNGKPVPVDIPQPFVELQWGIYLFVPSMAAIKTIVEQPHEPARTGEAAEAAEAGRGEAIVARLFQEARAGPAGLRRAAAGWKTVLEDFSAKDPAEKSEGPAVWAAIRRNHGGALRVPYGIFAEGADVRDAVLVASKELVMRVFDDREHHYSMRGQMARMEQSFGPIFLGLDDSPSYHAQADDVNAAIMAIDERKAFTLARGIAEVWLGNVFFLFATLYEKEEGEIDLRRDFITPILGGVCNQWFGIPDGFRREVRIPDVKDRCDPNHVDAAGWGWASIGSDGSGRKPRCPGDYMSTSRYCFYPDPSPAVQAYGREHGQGLREAVRAHFKALADRKVQPEAELAAVMRELFADDDELARTLIGVMTGFLPPADGSLRLTLYDWLEEKMLWRAQDDLISHPSKDAYVRASEALRPWLERAMQKRPSPDILWRTATREHRLGDVNVEADDRVFIGIVSALAEDAAVGITDVYPIFGGKREKPRPPAAPGAAVSPCGKAHEGPLHACPAYEAAMGTMLGMLSALLESVRIGALPGSLLVRLSDPIQPIRESVAKRLKAEAVAAAALAGAAAGAAAALSPGGATAAAPPGDTTARWTGSPEQFSDSPAELLAAPAK